MMQPNELRNSRVAALLTQAELAGRLCVSPQTIHLWENGAQPSFRMERRIRKFLADSSYQHGVSP